ncbi:hypothetical protein V5O48_005251 [Marasmius crinis-equi]|uniref:Uncharacterized protein n=1 Tax=Marasmius crinis-equi TaxID=585013 RepID=A0ABR3FNI9_9AGAR
MTSPLEPRSLLPGIGSMLKDSEKDMLWRVSVDRLLGFLRDFDYFTPWAQIFAHLPFSSILAMSQVNRGLRGHLHAETAEAMLLKIGRSRGVPSPPQGHSVLQWWRLLVGSSFLCEACGREAVPLNFSILRHLCSSCTFFAYRTPHTFVEVFGDSYTKFTGPVEQLLFLDTQYCVFVPPTYLWEDPTKCLPPSDQDLSCLEESTEPAARRALDVRKRIPVNVQWWECSLQGRCFTAGVQLSPSLWSLLEARTGWHREQVLSDAIWRLAQRPFLEKVKRLVCTLIAQADSPFSHQFSEALASGVSSFRRKLKPTSRLLPSFNALLSFPPVVEKFTATHRDLIKPRVVSELLYKKRETLFREVDRFRRKTANRFLSLGGLSVAYASFSIAPNLTSSDWRTIGSLAVIQLLCDSCDHLSVTPLAFLNHLNSQGVLCAFASWENALNPVFQPAAPALVLLSGLDPSTASADDIDALGYVYECRLCSVHSPTFRGSWREMILHYHRSHASTHAEHTPSTLSPETMFVVLGEAPLFPDAFQTLEWTCARCQAYVSARATREEVIEHLALVHRIGNPRVPGDYYYVGY